MNSVNNNQTSVLGGTLVAGGIGAIASGATNYVMHKKVIAEPDKFISQSKEAIKNLKAQNYPAKILEKLKHGLAEMRLLRKTKEVNWKLIGKHAGKTAAVFAGIYLGYRAIKGLFSSKENS